jgi:hypothetical protein
VAVVGVDTPRISQAYYQPLLHRHAAILAYRLCLRRDGTL